MLPHSFGHDVEALQSEGRGPVMGASASSNRTTAFDESSGILGFVSSRFRRSGRRKNKNKADGDPLPPSSAGNEVGVFVFHERDGESRGGGAVTCEHSGDSTDTTSTASSRHSSRQDRDESPSRGTDTRLAALADASHSMTTKREAAQQSGENIATRHRGNAAAAAAVLQTGTGNVHVSPSSSSSSSSASSGTEYAPPSSDGEEDDGRGQVRGGRSPDKQGQQPPHPHAFNAAAPQPTKKEQGDESGKVDGHGGGASARHVKGETMRPSHSSPTDSSHSTTASTSTSADSTSDTDDEDGDGEDDDGDSDDDRAYSKMTEQSEGPSSRVPFSNSGVHRHTIASPASANYYAPTRDVRSSLVSTIDVDVAVVRERRRQRQHHLYLQAALRQGSTAAGTAASPSTLTPAQSGFLRQRADAVYRRHMDALVEQYLSAPRYRTALAQFRKHLSAPEQEMRTAEAWGQYMRATQVSMPRPQEDEGGGESRGNKAAAAAAAGREGDWWRVGSGNAGDGAAAAAAATAGGGSSSGAAAAVAPVHSGADRYRIEKTDLELLVGDAARRARLLDDTLPWRPIDFDATGIRLEALEHLQADLGGTDAITGGSVAPAVGGSVNLLIEVLILTEMDVPFTSTIPMVNYTNVFLLLASLFVQSEVLLTKLIRLYRSVRAWEAEVEDTTRAVYLERRVLQCILVYCRVHEADLTLSCLQRLAVFVASEGFLGPVNVLNDAVGKEQWPCQEGVYCPARRRAAAYAHAMSTAAATSAAASPTSTSVPAFAGTRHYKRHGFLEPRRAVVDGGVAGLFPQRTATFDPSAVLNPATRAPLQSEVAQTLLEFIVYLQRTIAVYYRAIEIAPQTRQALPFTPEGPLRMYVDTAVLRPGLGCTSTSLRTAMTADPRLSPEPFYSAESVGARFSERVPGSSSDRRPGSSGSPSRDHRFGGGGGENVMVLNRAYDGRSGEGYRGGSTTFGEAQQGRGLGGGAGGAGGPWSNGPSPAPQPSTLETTVTQRPLSAVDIDAEHLARQICLLSFSLFTAVHIRELLNNAWTDTAMRGSVSRKLTELMEFSAHLQRWTAAVIVTPATWPECQRALRYFLEVCRMLYEQQNYEMAAAILEGLRHPSVEYLERVFAEARGQGLLSAVERRELETLMELMDPFASYSPSSLYSVTARTVGDMETPMIPLLAPILGVIFRSEEIKGSTVSIRSSDGQAVVNWSKVTGLGKMVVLWMRCQYTPFAFPVDPEMQEFLWSTMNHQWTDALLMRAARRVKQ